MSSVQRIAAAVALIAGTAFVTAEIVAARTPRAQDPGAPDMADPEMAAMLEKTMKLAAPGPQHELLTKLAGDWEQTYEMRWAPDAEWMKTTGKSVAESLLDGRYLMERVKFEVMGMPIEGIHTLGYDNMNGEYISLWMDSMSTWWVTARGKAREDGAIETKGTMVDAAGSRPYRMVIRAESPDHVVSEMYDTIPPHGEILVMKIDSKRVK